MAVRKENVNYTNLGHGRFLNVHEKGMLKE